MGLNPGDNPKIEALRRRILDDNFNDGSPYHAMYRCGYYGVPLEDCVDKCRRNGIALRQKDIMNYNNGVFKRGIGSIVANGQTVNAMCIKPGIQFEDMKLSDFPSLPIDWHGTERRFFPCSTDNKPLMKWGWSKNPDGSIYSPNLYTMADAKALSPCGWVGQNMLYQRFIVVDIDGRGHGADDLPVIAFGSQFKCSTLTMEDPMKPGSFHLYFETDKLIPVRHFPWAKLDLMGNAVNAAVYFKNKVSNGLPPIKLDEDIWQSIIEYESSRKKV